MEKKGWFPSFCIFFIEEGCSSEESFLLSCGHSVQCKLRGGRGAQKVGREKGHVCSQPTCRDRVFVWCSRALEHKACCACRELVLHSYFLAVLVVFDTDP